MAPSPSLLRPRTAPVRYVTGGYTLSPYTNLDIKVLFCSHSYHISPHAHDCSPNLTSIALPLPPPQPAGSFSARSTTSADSTPVAAAEGNASRAAPSPYPSHFSTAVVVGEDGEVQPSAFRCADKNQRAHITIAAFLSLLRRVVAT
jgi:hypothetical protein